MNVVSDSMRERLLHQLADEESALAATAEQYDEIKSRLEMGLRRYRALREYATEQFGISPYSTDVTWPDGARFDAHGRFRFWGMRVGDAVLEVLRDARDRHQDFGRMTLDQITIELASGGLGAMEPVQARAVNAAIQAHLKTGAVLRRPFISIGKNPTVLYQIGGGSDADNQSENGDDIDPDDLPF